MDEVKNKFKAKHKKKGKESNGLVARKRLLWQVREGKIRTLSATASQITEVSALVRASLLLRIKKTFTEHLRPALATTIFFFTLNSSNFLSARNKVTVKTRRICCVHLPPFCQTPTKNLLQCCCFFCCDNRAKTCL